MLTRPLPFAATAPRRCQQREARAAASAATPSCGCRLQASFVRLRSEALDAFSARAPVVRPPSLRASTLLCRAGPTPPFRVSTLAARPAPPPLRASPPPKNAYNGTFLLILLNVLLYVADHVLHLPVSFLYLQHGALRWFQYFTCTFCHASFEHLSGNLFLLLVFGKSVEEEGGAVGVWLSYLTTGVGASVASVLLLPALRGGAHVVSLGASGAVFGLFVISALSKLSWDWRKLLESAILGTFVWERLWHEARVALTASKNS